MQPVTTVGAFVALVALVPFLAPAQQRPASQPAAASAGDAAISGVVKNATTGQPIADAIVQLMPFRADGRPASASQRQFTDTRGRFVFVDLPQGDYQVMASKAGFFDGGYGGTGATYVASVFSPIRLRGRQWFSTADVLLARPGSISGTVRDERGEPVIGVYVRVLARITIAGTDHLAAGQITLTDDRGMFRVGQLGPGRYLAMVPSVQSSAPALTPLTTLVGASAQTLENLRRADGTFSDRPIVDIDANTRLMVGGYPVPPPAENGRAMSYPIAYSGGTSIAQAAPVVLEPGMDRTGVDIQLNPAPVSRISGVVQGPAEAIASLGLRLVPEGLEELASGGEAATALVASDGSFAFVNVPAGNYTIDASASLNQYLVGPIGLTLAAPLPFPPGLRIRSMEAGGVSGLDGIAYSSSPLARSYWARTALTVGAQDLSNVVVTLRPLMTMRGRFVTDVDPAFPAPSTAPPYFWLESATGNPWNGAPSSQNSRDSAPGEFTIEGITPGLYLLRGQSIRITAKSILVGGREHLNTPIDTATDDLSNVVVTLTNAQQSLTGSVTKTNGEAADAAAVILFPAEPEQWTNVGINPTRIQSVRVATDGAFRFGTLPAGDYYVVAVPEARRSAWHAPGFFARAQGVATRLTIAWGEQKTAALKLVEVR